MAYPMRKWPSWEELLKELEPLGIVVQEIEVSVNGETRKMHRLVNERSRKKWPAVIDPDSVKHPIGPEAIRSICKRLRLNPRDIEGFRLD